MSDVRVFFPSKTSRAANARRLLGFIISDIRRIAGGEVSLLPRTEQLYTQADALLEEIEEKGDKLTGT